MDTNTEQLDTFTYIDRLCDQHLMGQGDLFPLYPADLYHRVSKAHDEGELSTDEWRYLCRRIGRINTNQGGVL